MNDVRHQPATYRFVRRLGRSLNTPLLVGIACVLTVIGSAVCAPLLTAHDPYEAVNIFDGTTLLQPPYAPGVGRMPLGSDIYRYDLWSRLLYGARATVLLAGIATLIRISIGMTIGLLAGWYTRLNGLIGVLVNTSSAIPSLIFAIIPIELANQYVIAHRNEGMTRSIVAFLVALSLTGWAEIATQLRIAVQTLRATPFIESAYSIGQRSHLILWRHVVPNLRSLLLVEAAYSVAAVLLLIAELGFLGFYLGAGAIEIDFATKRTIITPNVAEWGSMLASGIRYRRAVLPTLAPLLAFALTILGFNLLAEGLRRSR